MKHNLPLTTRIILPTHELLRDYAATSNLLAGVDLTTTLVVEYYLLQWLQHQQPYLTAPWVDGPVHRHLLALVITDLLQSTRFDKLDRTDRQDLYKVLNVICDRSYFELVPLIEGLGLNERQLEHLEIKGWLGWDLILHLPHVDPRRI